MSYAKDFKIKTDDGGYVSVARIDSVNAETGIDVKYHLCVGVTEPGHFEDTMVVLTDVELADLVTLTKRIRSRT